MSVNIYNIVFILLLLLLSLLLFFIIIWKNKDYYAIIAHLVFLPVITVSAHISNQNKFVVTC